MSFCPTVALAASSGTCGENLTWALSEDGTLTVSGSGDMADYTSQNLAPWYGDRGSIQKVVIENGVTSIGNYAFQNCRKLTGVEIPGSVKSIGTTAFNSCSALTSVKMAEGIETLGSRAFAADNNLKNIEVPSSIKAFSKAESPFGSRASTMEIIYAGTLAQWKQIDSGSAFEGTVYGAPHTVTVDGGGSTGSTDTGPYNEGKTVTVYAGA